MNSNQVKHSRKLVQLKRLIMAQYRADIKDMDIIYADVKGVRGGEAGFQLTYAIKFKDPRIESTDIQCSYSRDISQVPVPIMFRPFRGAMNDIMAAALIKNAATID